jgi:hypothetical protein
MNHQPNEIAARLLARIGIGLGAVTAVVMVICWFLWNGYADAPFQAVAPTPMPSLQVQPAKDRRLFQQTQNAGQVTYGWVDQEHGVARIPVRRAMLLMAKERKP